MDVVLGVDWVALLALSIAALCFEILHALSKKISWTSVLLIALAAGMALGGVFSYDGNAHLVWLQFLGDAYVSVITALVVPVVFVSVLSGFISLGDKAKMRDIGVRSVIWLLAGTAVAIVLSLAAGLALGLGKGAAPVFSGISDVSQGSIAAYENLRTSFDQVLLALVPSNVVADMASDNVVAVIVAAVALAVAYVSVASEEGAQEVAPFKSFFEALKKVIYRVLRYVIRLTPYAALCLIACAAGQRLADWTAMAQLLVLVAVVYAVCFAQALVANGVLVRLVAKLPPVAFFKKIAPALVTAFTTQSSLGTLPVSVEGLTRRVGVDEEVANFTTPLGATIGMPGCTAVWPILLAVFYINAVGLDWGLGDYVVMAALTLALSFGVAGVPGIGVVSAIALFNAVGLPTAAVILMLPINTVTDMARTMDNVSNANVAAAIVARRTGALDDAVFAGGQDGSEKRG